MKTKKYFEQLKGKLEAMRRLPIYVVVDVYSLADFLSLDINSL